MLNKKYNFRRWFLIAFALVCVGLNIGVYTLYEKNESVEESKQWVQHSYNVLNLTNNMFFQLQDMQIAVRGYLLSEDEKFLGSYYAAAKIIDARFPELLAMTQDNPNRQIQLLALQKIFEKQRALMRRQIYLRKSKGIYSLRDMNNSKAYMDEIRKINAEMMSSEQQLLAQRSTQARKVQRNFVTTLFATAGASIIGLLAANGVIAFLSIRRMSAEDNLRRINKELEGFTYIASHDLKSPLVNLRGFASEMAMSLNEAEPLLEKSFASLPADERLQAEAIFKKDIPDSLRYIHSSVEKMNKLTNGILELSRLGKRNLSIKEIDVNLLVRNAVNVLQHQITKKNIAVTIGDLPRVTTDMLSLEQVFGNIIDNAVKYLDPERPGIIEIGGQRNRQTTTYWVRDNGRGIRADDMQKIFEIYRRAGNNADIPGEGLGMAYVRTILRRMKGRIWCESTPDVGTTFYFTLASALLKEELIHD